MPLKSRTSVLKISPYMVRAAHANQHDMPREILVADDPASVSFDETVFCSMAYTDLPILSGESFDFVYHRDPVNSDEDLVLEPNVLGTITESYIQNPPQIKVSDVVKLTLGIEEQLRTSGVVSFTQGSPAGEEFLAANAPKSVGPRLK